uniref:Uncharacterized protein n=1 Tax=Nothobranchius kadleci TaxID=1051664 RepID=A0A1A8CV30_NOTKA
MATAKKLAEELEEIKQSLNFLSEEISKVAKQQANLMGLMEELQELKASIKQKDQKIERMEQRIDDLEQNARANDILITGLATKHRSYARATAGYQEGEEAPPEELHTLEEQVVQFFSVKKINLNKGQISACYTVPRKDNRNKSSIVVQLVNRKQKIDILSQSRKLKGSGVYVNKHLTKKQMLK